VLDACCQRLAAMNYGREIRSCEEMNNLPQGRKGQLPSFLCGSGTFAPLRETVLLVSGAFHSFILNAASWRSDAALGPWWSLPTSEALTGLSTPSSSASTKIYVPAPSNFLHRRLDDTSTPGQLRRRELSPIMNAEPRRQDPRYGLFNCPEASGGDSGTGVRV